MVSKEQAKIIKEIKDNKNKFLEMATSSKKKKLEELYEKFTPAFNLYYVSLLGDTSARMDYDQAMRTHKIDPAIAGGIGHGIAGVGAGFYVANSAAQNNKNIDAARAQAKNRVAQTSSFLSGNEIHLMGIVEKIDKLLNSIPKIKEYREENIYNEAKALMKKRDYEEAAELFDTIANYKDSAMQKDNCLAKHKKKIITVSVSVSIYMLALLITTIVCCVISC